MATDLRALELSTVYNQPLDLSIVIPVYNECESLRILHNKIVEVLAPLAIAWEVIYIDDGSTDGSTKLLRDLQAIDPHIVVIVQRRNFGKSPALAAGFAVIRGNVVINMDADLQDEPAEIPRLLAKLHEGYDVVLGWRQTRHDRPTKIMASHFANAMTTLLTGVRVKDMNSGLKAYTAECVEQLHMYGDMHRYIPVLAHYGGFSIAEIPVAHHKRQFGKSKYSTGRFLRGGLDLLTVVFLNQYGRRPLHLFGLVGGICLAIGTLINLGLTWEWLQGYRPIGNRPALMLGVLLMLIGFQILTSGLIAELVVAFMQKNDSPLRTVRKIYRADEAHRETEAQER
jgi:glycosyltransferase involved in cell wall biosynthesis